MLTCQQITELVTDHLEGTLSLRGRAQFYLHVGMCRHCRAYLRQMKATVETLGELPGEPMSDSMRSELLACFRELNPGGTEETASRPVEASKGHKVFAVIERLGSRHGKTIIASIVALLAAVLLATDLSADPAAADVRCGIRCLVIEVGLGAALLAGLGAVAWRKVPKFSASTLATMATVGALGGFAMLQAKCELTHVASHVLVFHLGGIPAAALLGAAASRLPVWR